MATNKIIKMEIDYSTEYPKWAEEMNGLKSMDEIFEKLYSYEKLTRQAADAITTGKLLEYFVVRCTELGEWKKLNEHLLLFTKKRGQLKQAVTKMIQKVCEYVDKTPNEETKLELINCIRNVTEGKIYVENERARISKKLADIKERNNDVDAAAAILQDLQVETYGSMEKKEKIEFILEQMRLCLAKKDYIRTQIISKKISSRSFQDETLELLKLKFYRLMIQLDLAETNFLNTSKHYYEIYQSKTIKENEQERLNTLKNVMLYLLLSSYDNEQHDLLYRHKSMCSRDLENLEMISEIIEKFCTKEVMIWKDFCDSFEEALKSDEVFSGEDGLKRWETLHSRVIQHNIRVMAGYYSQIRLSRMAGLLDIAESELENYLDDLVVSKTVDAKIDRLDGVVHFVRAKKDAGQTLEEWSENIDKLLGLIRHTNHLINKEKMVHQVA